MSAPIPQPGPSRADDAPGGPRTDPSSAPPLCAEPDCHPWRPRVLGIGLAALVVSLAVLAMFPASPIAQYGVQSLTALFGVAAMVVAAVRLRGAQRWAWTGVALALACQGAAFVIDGFDPPTSLGANGVAVALSIAGIPFAVAGAMAMVASYIVLARLRTVLDALLVSCGTLFVAWVAFVGDLPGNPSPVDLLNPLADVAYLVVLGFLLHRTEGRFRRPLWLVCLASAAILASDLVQTFGSVPNGPPVPMSGIFATIGSVLLGLGALHAGPLRGRHDDERTPRLQTFLPYLAVALSVAAGAAWRLRVGALDEVLTWDALAILLLLIARQYLVLGENVRLTDSLRRQAELLRGSEERFRGLVQNSSDVVAVVDQAGVVRYVSPAVRGVLGIGPEAWIDRGLAGHVHPDDSLVTVTRVLALVGSGGAGAPLSFRVRHASGRWRHVEALPSDLSGTQGVDGVVLNIRDVTERRELEAQLRHDAFHDPLTGLPNRALLHDRVAHALLRAERAGLSVALLFIDLDDFKTVNDSLGHASGDALLRVLSARIAECLRTTDTAARLGGDEFAVLLEGGVTVDDAREVAARLLDALALPVELGTVVFHARASIGIAISDGRDGTDRLLRRADVAMYRAKAQGKGSHVLFDAGMELVANQRLAFDTEMRSALALGELVLHYQPIIELVQGRIVGAEALIRWNHPTRGLVQPCDFIPLAEETGLVIQIGQWVLHEACHAAAAWQDEGRPFDVSVNVSAKHLLTDHFIGDVVSALESSGFDPRRLVVELTESALVTDVARAHEQLNQLKSFGVRVALDDFGTGFSSLGHLRDLPVDIVKIDRSFLQIIGGPGRATEFVRGIQALSHSLSLTTVAEGVEELVQLEALRSMDVERAQGYFFSRAVDADAMLVLLRGLPYSLSEAAPQPGVETASVRKAG